MDKLRVGSLFSGIGGIELGLHRTGGFETVWMNEIDPHARKVLALRFPGLPIYDDVRDIGIKYDVPPVDVLVGGFPCQDISNAGKRKGIDGERSGLWSEYARIIRMVRPRYVIVENVAALLARNKRAGTAAPIARVLGELSESGYDAEWQIISAASVGAPHLRERVFIVAYPSDFGCDNRGDHRRERYVQAHQERNHSQALADRKQLLSQPGKVRPILSDPNMQGLEEWEVFGGNAAEELAAIKRSSSEGTGQWAVEPALDRVVDGLSGRVDASIRKREIIRLGNAVVPQVAEFVGRQILAREAKIQEYISQAA